MLKVVIRGALAQSASLALLAILACGVAEAAVELTHQSTDLVRYNYFRLSPQGSVVDAAGELHVFARDSGVVERHLDAGVWVSEPVDPYVGAGTDLSASIGPDGVMHVIYQTFEPCVECTSPGFFINRLRYARKIAGTWQVTNLDEMRKEVLSLAKGRALAGGNGGTLDVLSFGAIFNPDSITGGLFHSRFDGSAWSHEKVLDAGSPGATDVRVLGLSRAPDGSLHGAVLKVSGDGSERLYYLNKAPGDPWQTRVVKDYVSADNISIFIGIAATDATTADILVSSYDTLDHFHVTANSVDTFVLDNAGQPFGGAITYPALVATAGQPLTAAFNVRAISNQDQDAYELWVATFNGLVWTAEKVYGTGMFGSGTELPSLVDPPQVHYAGGVLHVLNKTTGFYADRPGDVQPVSDWTKVLGVWERDTVIQSQAHPALPGKRVAATADAQGRIHALHLAEDRDVFTGRDSGFVAYAAETGAAPVSEVIPHNGGIVLAEGLAIAVAPDGTVHGMTEGGNFIRYLVRDNGTWTVDDVATPFDHVEHSRMAMLLDAGEHVHACLYRNVFADSQSQVRLYYLTNATGSWSEEPISALMGRESGHHMACAIRILDADTVHVAYVDNAGDLRKAVRGSGTWSDVVVAANSPVRQRQQIAPYIDADGFVHASFTLVIPFGPSYVPNGIRYGNNRGVIWVEELVDDDAQLGIQADYLYRSEIDDYSPLYASRIAQTPDGRIYLFYYDEGLYIARGSVRVNGAWRNFAVDVTETAGPFGDVVALPDNTVRYVHAVERSAALRTTASVPGPALFLQGDATFPDIVVGDSVTASFTVVNHGAQALSLTDLTLYTDSYRFLPEGTCGPTTVLQPGQTCSLVVEYEPAPYETQPTTSSERLALLLIESNDPWSPVGFLFEGLTHPAETGGGGGGGGPLPLGVSAGLLLLTLLRRAQTTSRE